MITDDKKLDRSLESVERVFEAIRKELRQHPDLRVGQIIANASYGDTFLIENDILAGRINAQRTADWLSAAEQRFPRGIAVRVVRSDLEHYVGRMGKVIGYDVGDIGEWPLVRVAFDEPSREKQDAFSGNGDNDDEIEAVKIHEKTP